MQKVFGNLYHSHDIGSTISRLEETVYKYPHLLLGIVASGFMAIAETEGIMKGQHAFIQRTKADVLVEQYIILLNRFCEFKVSPSTITNLYEGFRVY